MSPVFATRVAFVAALVVLTVHSSSAQYFVDVVWARARSFTFVRLAYFETLFVSVYYAFLMLVHLAATHLRGLDKFRLSALRDNPDMRYSLASLSLALIEYNLPLAILDAIVPKTWCTAESSGPRMRDFPIIWRPLPDVAPTVTQLLWQPIAALIAVCIGCEGDALFLLPSSPQYDMMFYVFHRFVLHGLLWSSVHRVHHQHQSLIASYTNRLALFERVAIVLLANECLKLFCAHPLTRFVFILEFVYLLVDR